MTLRIYRPVLIKLCAVLLFTVLQAAAFAQQPASFSLKQAQEFALLNSAAIKNSDIDLQLARKKIWETTAIGLPQANAQLNYQHIFEVPAISFGGITFLNTNLPDGTPITADDIRNENLYLDFTPGEPIPLALQDQTTLDFTVSQLVFSGEYLVGLRASRVFYQISEQAKTKAEYDTRESVANSYALVLMLDDTRNIMAQSLENINKTLREMQEMHKQGFIEITDVDQIELTVLTLENGVNSMQRQTDAARQLLKFQMGYPMEDDIVLTDSLETLAGAVKLDDLVSPAFRIENNINYQILDTQVKLNKLNLQREKSTFLPSIAAVYKHTEKFKKIEFDFMPVDVVALSVNIPLLSSGQRYVKVQQRRLEYDKSVINRDNAAEGLRLEYVNARNEVINAFDNYSNVKKNLELTRRIYDKTLIKFKEGLSSSMDLTQAQNQYLSAQSEYIRNLNALLAANNKLTTLTTSNQ